MLASVRHFADAIRGIVRAQARRLVPWKPYVVHRGHRLPRPEGRLNGPDQRDDEFYVQSCLAEARRVREALECNPDELVVDVGCGQGRLAIGLSSGGRRQRYVGIDVSAESINWCVQHISARFPSYRFVHLDLINARYNPGGAALADEFKFPVADGEATVVYMWGVVTNMEPEHLPAYAAEIRRILMPGGRLFLTANVEEYVPPVSINPEGYTAFTCNGPLHIVRYERGYFNGFFERAGLMLSGFAHHAAGNCQSDLYFIKQVGGMR